MYELHLTVNTKNIEDFKKVCNKLNVKPIVIDLQDKTGNTVFHDVMTSSKYNGYDIEEELIRIKNGLKENNFDTIRVKIETSPFHKSVPNKDNKLAVLSNNYFESHIRVLTTKERIEELRKLCYNKAHVSKNLFKRVEDGVQILLTIRRDIGVYEDFKIKVDEVVKLLNINKFTTDKIEVEYVLYDSNKSHDSKWIES
jgi:hypothetical protein